MKNKKMREQGLYGQTAPAPGAKRQPQNVVHATSPRKKAPKDNPTKTPAPVGKGSKGSPGNISGQKGAKMSKHESATRKKVRGP